MPVVVNEFEVLPAAPAAPPAKQGDGKDQASEKLAPCALAAALRLLETQALRSWAH
jgi:hypothetical protein